MEVSYLFGHAVRKLTCDLACPRDRPSDRPPATQPPRAKRDFLRLRHVHGPVGLARLRASHGRGLQNSRIWPEHGREAESSRISRIWPDGILQPDDPPWTVEMVVRIAVGTEEAIEVTAVDVGEMTHPETGKNPVQGGRQVPQSASALEGRGWRVCRRKTRPLLPLRHCWG